MSPLSPQASPSGLVAVTARWVIPVDGEKRDSIEDGAVVYDKASGLIEYVGPASGLKDFENITERVVLEGEQILMPGLINMHCHSPMIMMKGFSEDLSLHVWLGEVWEAERALIDDEFIAIGTALACREMLLTGTTTFVDMYFRSDVSARVAKQAGMRIALGDTILDPVGKAAELAGETPLRSDELQNIDSVSPTVSEFGSRKSSNASQVATSEITSSFTSQVSKSSSTFRGSAYGSPRLPSFDRFMLNEEGGGSPRSAGFTLSSVDQSPTVVELVRKHRITSPSLLKSLEIHEKLTTGTDKLSTISLLSPHSTYTVPIADLKKVKALSEELNVRVNIHVHETIKEVEDHQAQNEGDTPFRTLDKLGLVNDRMIAAHCVHMTHEEIQLMGRKGVTAVTCPKSNLKLASGMCDVQAMLNAGVNVTIGTDGSCSNNSLDLLGDMQWVALVAKVKDLDPSAVTCRQVIKMGTINGAKGLGLEDKIGSLEKNKLCDMIAVDFNDLMAQPVLDPLSSIVHTSAGKKVSNVWVGGKQVVKNGKLLTLNVNEATLEKFKTALKELMKNH